VNICIIDRQQLFLTLAAPSHCKNVDQMCILDSRGAISQRQT